MDWFVFWERVKENLNWIIPSITSLFFALVTTILIFAQAKWQKNERKINADFMAHQSNLQEAQICIALAEKRLKIYQVFKDVFRDISNKEGADISILRSFRSNAAGLEFFFGDDIQSFYSELEEMISTYRLVSYKIARVNKGIGPDPKHSENVEKQLNMVEKFDMIEATLAEKFKPYFDFSKYQVN